MRRRAFTLPDRFGRCLPPPQPRSMADDARALLVALYGTEGPPRCPHTASLFPEAPRGAPASQAPTAAPCQFSLFTSPLSTSKE